MKKTALLFLCLCLTLSQAAAAAKQPTNVDLPVKVFSLRKGEKNPKIRGRFWGGAAAEAKTVLILAPFENGAYSKIARAVAEELAKKSVPTLWLDPRAPGDRAFTVSLEDVQTGVVFLRSDPRVKTPAPSQVAVLTFGESAVGAAQYAGSNKQVGMLLENTVFFDPKYKNDEELQNLIEACKPRCNSVTSTKDSSTQENTKEIAERLQKIVHPSSGE